MKKELIISKRANMGKEDIILDYFVVSEKKISEEKDDRSAYVFGIGLGKRQFPAQRKGLKEYYEYDEAKGISERRKDVLLLIERLAKGKVTPYALCEILDEIL